MYDFKFLERFYVKILIKIYFRYIVPSGFASESTCFVDKAFYPYG